MLMARMAGKSFETNKAQPKTVTNTTPCSTWKSVLTLPFVLWISPERAEPSNVPSYLRQIVAADSIRLSFNDFLCLVAIFGPTRF